MSSCATRRTFDLSCTHIRNIIMSPGPILASRKVLPIAGRSSIVESLLRAMSLADFIIVIAGFSFRNGQPPSVAKFSAVSMTSSNIGRGLGWTRFCSQTVHWPSEVRDKGPERTQRSCWSGRAVGRIYFVVAVFSWRAGLPASVTSKSVRMARVTRSSISIARRSVTG